MSIKRASIKRGPITRWLENAPAQAFIAYAIFAAFWTYFCMYAFRKPFSAAAYEGMGIAVPFVGQTLKLKTTFIIAQIIGYCLSKYLGMKFCSEVRTEYRFRYLITAIVLGELALVMFAVVPGRWKVLAIFLNGLPLGLVWGLVVRFLEGRTTSELLLAGLSCSFIVASGIVKSVGRWLMDAWSVDPYWMPAAAGALFFIPFVLATWLLNQMPPPTEVDVDLRMERPSMARRERWQFMRTFLPGLILLTVAYFFLTAYRDFRDNYMLEIYGHFKAEEFIDYVVDEGTLHQQRVPELKQHLAASGIAEDERAEAALVWMQDQDLIDASMVAELRQSVDLKVSDEVFAKTDLPVGLIVLAPLALLTLIRNNRVALLFAYAIMLVGLATLGLGTLLLQAGSVSAYTWMVLVGAGAYLAYVPYGSVLFDRTIAATRFAGTAVFAIYVADAIGYTGSVGMQLYKDLYASDANRGEFFIGLTYFMSILGAIMLIGALIYFFPKTSAVAHPEHLAREGDELETGNGE